MENKFPLSCVILAAGYSRRMGEPKLQMAFRDSTVLGTTLAAVAKAPFRERVLVVRKNPGGVPAEIRVLEIGDGALAGMHFSLKSGIAALKDPGEGICIALGDQPYLHAEDYAELARQWKLAKASGCDLLFPENSKQRGNPSVIGAGYLAEVQAQPDDDRGCHYLFKRHPERVKAWRTESPGFYLDLDEKSDFYRD
jgi:molybdenum cofactor cytidylyltransferase